jgi:hypothetical protein
MTMQDIIDPRGNIAAISTSGKTKTANWPGSLRQASAGFLGNGKPNVASFFERLAGVLEAHGAKTSCSLVKPGPTTPAGEERVAQLAASSNLVITGVCDGGTATSWGVHDALMLASRGIPVVLVCTQAFLLLAKSMLPENLPGLRVLTIPHPFSSLTDRQVDALAAEIAPRLLSIVQPDGDMPRSGDRGCKPPSALRDTGSDESALSQWMYEAGWTDGLPAFLPTRARVRHMLEGWRGVFDGAGTPVAPRNGLATPETIAANAVLTGMPARLLPYLAAALEASCKPEFNLFGIQTTTNPAATAVIVGGPQRRAYGFNDGLGALGPGNLSNATLGRALRLCHQNLGGVSARAGTDPATLGQPGKYVFCFAEDEDANPWLPLRMQVDPALSADDDAVTLMAATGTTNMIIKSRDGEELLGMLASSLRCTGSNDYMFGGHPLLILCPEHAAILERDGWTLDAFKQRLFETTKIRFSEFLPKNQEMTLAPRAHEFERLEPDTLLPMVAQPADLLVCVAGGPSMHSTFVPSFGGFRPATARVRF